MCAGFFSKMFAKEPQVITTTVESVVLLVEKEFLLQKAALEDFSAKKISENKYLHSRAINLLKIVSEKELEGKPNERLNRAAFTAKNQLVNQMNKLLEKLDPKERGNSLNDARHYAGESYALLVNEINSVRKNIAYTSFYLKEEMKSLGEALQSMVNLFHEMNLEFNNASGFFEFEKLKEKVGKVLQKKNELIKIGADIALLHQKISQKEELILTQNKKISDRKSGSEMGRINAAEGEMNKLMNEKQELKTEISSLLLNIDRPLARFKQLVDSGRWKIPNEEKEMLALFLTNPMFALKKDPKADVFKRVLSEVVKAIEQGKIELKDKEKEKRLGALQEIINFDFFGSVFWKMNEIQKKQADLNKLLEKSETKRDIENEENKVKSIENEIEENKG
ncbi:MAG: hypothetical protein WCI04_06890, partial [archaeon]